MITPEGGGIPGAGQGVTKVPAAFGNEFVGFWSLFSHFSWRTIYDRLGPERRGVTSVERPLGRPKWRSGERWTGKRDLPSGRTIWTDGLTGLSFVLLGK